MGQKRALIRALLKITNMTFKIPNEVVLETLNHPLI